jgi:hypothetical protein
MIAMSAFAPIADFHECGRHVRLVPNSDIAPVHSITSSVMGSMTWLGLFVSDGLRETGLEKEPSHAEEWVWCRVTLKGAW